MVSGSTFAADVGLNESRSPSWSTRQVETETESPIANGWLTVSTKGPVGTLEETPALALSYLLASLASARKLTGFFHHETMFHLAFCDILKHTVVRLGRGLV